MILVKENVVELPHIDHFSALPAFPEIVERLLTSPADGLTPWQWYGNNSVTIDSLLSLSLAIRFLL
jgi:hypothetical protein